MIQWYPGHMAKARREITETLRLTDVAVEVLDARAPLATENPDLNKLLGNKPRVVVLNKEDRADAAVTKRWLAWYTEKGAQAVPFCALRS
ncbi:MAG: ribosome biogenesis GTPase YlqF, partial [Clostridia bacterium]|nr:ribosome biogenesis GTPase YlqF [Clostridia bacterium]